MLYKEIIAVWYDINTKHIYIYIYIYVVDRIKNFLTLNLVTKEETTELRGLIS
jgi:hypothetical protein